MTAYADTRERLSSYRQKIAGLRKEMRELQGAVEPQVVSDYEFAGPDGPVKLSELFGDKDDLFIIHNMGTGCSYCTLWADGFNGVYDHMADRAAFVLTSPNSPEVQAKFAQSRGWKFPMVSHQGTSFADDMGYKRAEGWYPGVSAFQRKVGVILRVSDQELGPGDDFCAVWHFLDMLPQGKGPWQPRFSYAAA